MKQPRTARRMQSNPALDPSRSEATQFTHECEGSRERPDYSSIGGPCQSSCRQDRQNLRTSHGSMLVCRAIAAVGLSTDFEQTQLMENWAGIDCIVVASAICEVPQSPALKPDCSGGIIRKMATRRLKSSSCDLVQMLRHSGIA